MACCLLHQAFTWTNVDNSLVRSCAIKISQQLLKIYAIDMSFEITN